jgi:methionyl-tRNA formyltransferase
MSTPTSKPLSNKTLRLAFMGTPDFAVPSLLALAGAGHEIAAVYSQPPRPAGRGHKPRPSPVQAAAESRGWPVRTPASLKGEDAGRDFAALEIDAAVVVAYGLLLPKAILEAPRLGCFNVHASLLPRWRGAAPIQRAILAGDRMAGVSIMRMDEGLDTGPVVLSESLEIGPETTAGELHDALAERGARLLVQALEGVAAGRLEALAQPSEGVTYAAKIDRAESRIDWARPASEIHRQVRAFAPFPGAWFEAKGERVKLLAAEVVEGAGAGAGPGIILDDSLTIACGPGALRALRVQRAGKAPMTAQELLRGFTLPPGTRLP